MADDYTPTLGDVEDSWACAHVSEELTSEQARETFRVALAAHDAEKRSEWEAEQGTDEPEWEYGNEQLMHSHVEVFPASSEAVAKAQAWLYPVRRRRKAGPWEAVPAAENSEREEPNDADR